MPDGFVQMRRGETRPLYGQETMLTGSLTIQATPGPHGFVVQSGWNGGIRV